MNKAIILFILGLLICSPSFAARVDVGGGGSGSVSDTVYGAGWDGDTTVAPSKNAVYDKIETIASGGDNITVNTTAATNANFLDNLYMDWAINIASTPDDITSKFNYAETLAGDPALLVDECILFKDATGGGLLCEGSTADTSEQIYRVPDLNGADTDQEIVLDDATQTLTNKTIAAADNVVTADDLICTNCIDDTEITTNAGTALSADLEEEAHVSEHQENGADELLGETLGTACTDTQVLVANATGGLDCGSAGTGDITDVFSCASGDCASITMAATDLLNMSGTDASTATEGLILPQHATACAGGIAEGQVCWEADADILHIGDAVGLVDFVSTSAVSGEATMSTTGAVTLADTVTVTGWVLGASSATSFTSPTLLTDLIDGVGAVDIDLGSADITDFTVVTDGGTVVIDGTITQDAGTTLFMGGLLDATGAVDMDYGSADITDHTFIADGGTVIIDGNINSSTLTASEILITDGSKNIVSAAVATYPSLTELTYVKGVTSAIQTQINGKQATVTEGSLTDSVIVTADIKDGEILEADLNAIDAAGDEECLTSEGTGFEWQPCGGGADTNSVKTYVWPMAATLPLEAADSIPPITKDTGTNNDILAISFDDSTDECRTVNFIVPTDVQSGSTITFGIIWYSQTATTGNVIWDFRHTGTGTEGEDWDQALTTEASAADAVQGTVDLVTRTEWTETLANLGWAADDMISAAVCRDANAVGDTLVGDAEAITLYVEIPRA